MMQPVQNENVGHRALRYAQNAYVGLKAGSALLSAAGELASSARALRNQSHESKEEKSVIPKTVGMNMSRSVRGKPGNSVHHEKIKFRVGPVATYSTTTDGTVLCTVPITPAGLGNRARSFGGLYSFFRVKKLTLSYRTNVASSTNGALMCLYDADIVDEPKVGDVCNLATESQSQYAATFPVWNNFDLPVRTTGKWLYCSQVSSEPHTTVDGYIAILAAGGVAANTTYGSIWVEASIDFAYPAPTDTLSPVLVLDTPKGAVSGVKLWSRAAGDKPAYTGESRFWVAPYDSVTVPAWTHAVLHFRVTGTGLASPTVTKPSPPYVVVQEYSGFVSSDQKVAVMALELTTYSSPAELLPFVTFSTISDARCWVSTLPYSTAIAVELQKRDGHSSESQPQSEAVPTHSVPTVPTTSLGEPYYVLKRPAAH